MRMEELSEHRYLKKADTVEAYLLNLVQEYFRRTSNAPLTSMEYIIQKCLERMQEELDYEGVGVMSITLPGDETPRTGTVTITLEDLGGEPLITPKLTAFNVDFGQEHGTACEGDDPRLSDKRDPTPHQHQMSDIVGLEGIISSLTGKVERVNGLMHEHSNKDVLDMLIYTGDKSVIDLKHLEDLEDEVNRQLQDVRDHIIEYKNHVDIKVAEANQKLLECQQVAQQIHDFILQKNQEYLQLAKDYTDTQVTNAYNNAMTVIDNTYVKKTDAQQIAHIASNVYTVAGEIDIPIDATIDLSLTTQKVTVSITNDILDEIVARGKTLNDCQFEYVLYYDYNGKRTHQHLPFILFNDNNVDGSLRAATDVTSKKVILEYDSVSATADTTVLLTATLKYRVLSKKDVVLT